MNHRCPMARRPRALLAAVGGALAIVASSAGCGGSHGPTAPTGNGGAIAPAADSPTHAVERLAACLEAQAIAPYDSLLCVNYRFTFAGLVDPDLVSFYGDTWGPADEHAALTRLFDGFVNSQGISVPGASSITVQLGGVTVEDDSSHADSTAWYRRVVVSTCAAQIELPGPTPADAVRYEISASQHFLVVRGDAALLPPGVAPDPGRWYVRGWEDRALPIRRTDGGTSTASLKGITWGRLRAYYGD